jgi:tartrate/fumarate subfamily iron-sulfur-dependent hydro-lyase beta chain
VVYLTGHLVTCRDVAHRRLIEQGRELPVNLEGGAIFRRPHRAQEGRRPFEMVSIGPTTSMRMEKFEREFIKQTGVKLIVGKGGMGPETAAGCQEHKAVHAIFPVAVPCWPPPWWKRSKGRMAGPGHAGNPVDQPGAGIRPADHLHRHPGQ